MYTGGDISSDDSDAGVDDSNPFVKSPTLNHDLRPSSRSAAPVGNTTSDGFLVTGGDNDDIDATMGLNPFESDDDETNPFGEGTAEKVVDEGAVEGIEDTIFGETSEGGGSEVDPPSIAEADDWKEKKRRWMTRASQVTVDDFDLESIELESDNEDGALVDDGIESFSSGSSASKGACCWWVSAGLLWTLALLVLLFATLSVSLCFWLVSTCASPGCFVGFTLASVLIVELVFLGVFLSCRANRLRKRLRVRGACVLVELLLAFFAVQVLLVFAFPTASLFSDANGNILGSSVAVLRGNSTQQCASLEPLMQESRRIFGGCVEWPRLRVVVGGLPRLFAARDSDSLLVADSTVMASRCPQEERPWLHAMAHVMQWQQRWYFYAADGPSQLLQYASGLYAAQGPLEFQAHVEMREGFAAGQPFQSVFSAEQMAALVVDFLYSVRAGSLVEPAMLYYINQTLAVC